MTANGAPANASSCVNAHLLRGYAIDLHMPDVHSTQSLATMAGIAAVTLLAACGLEPAANETVSLNVEAKAPAVAVNDPLLDRSAVIMAAVRVASAVSAGEDDRGIQRNLDGRRFEVRIRFGCTTALGEPRGYTLNEDARSLRLQVSPDLSMDDPVAAGLGGEKFESVEGFWLQRPWMLSAACPASAHPQVQSKAEAGDTAIADSDRPVPPFVAWRLGIAQFYGEADSRTTRRNQRPYEVTKVLDADEQPSAQGYDFILTGRLRALPDKRVIACRAADPARPPHCIVSVHLDGARIERPDTRELLAEWSGT
jgi:hypothetical protein